MIKLQQIFLLLLMMIMTACSSNCSSNSENSKGKYGGETRTIESFNPELKPNKTNIPGEWETFGTIGDERAYIWSPPYLWAASLNDLVDGKETEFVSLYLPYRFNEVLATDYHNGYLYVIGHTKEKGRGFYSLKINGNSLELASEKIVTIVNDNYPAGMEEVLWCFRVFALSWPYAYGMEWTQGTPNEGQDDIFMVKWDENGNILESKSNHVIDFPEYPVELRQTSYIYDEMFYSTPLDGRWGFRCNIYLDCEFSDKDRWELQPMGCGKWDDKTICLGDIVGEEIKNKHYQGLQIFGVITNNLIFDAEFTEPSLYLDEIVIKQLMGPDAQHVSKETGFDAWSMGFGGVTPAKVVNNKTAYMIKLIEGSEYEPTERHLGFFLTWYDDTGIHVSSALAGKFLDSYADFAAMQFMDMNDDMVIFAGTQGMVVWDIRDIENPKMAHHIY